MRKLTFILVIIACMLASILCTTPIVLAENETKSSVDDKISNSKDVNSENIYSPQSKYMIMIDLDSSRILYSDESDKEFSPGGFVKILTAITAIENCGNLSNKVSPEMPILDDYDYESHGNIGLEYGEKMSVQNLIEAMMTTDAGDCALVLAHNIGKSYDDFIKLMNDTAKKAGAENSVFTDPAGFDDKYQKTTLEDMGKIVQYALKNSTFVNLASKEKIEIPSTNKKSSARIIFNTNNFLSKYYSLNYYNKNVKFSKTYYNNSDDCGIVTHYKDSTNNLLILCAKSRYITNNCGYDDVNYLIDYANKNYTQVTLISENEFIHEVKIDNGYNSDRVLLVSAGPVKAKLINNFDYSKIKKEISLVDNISAPIKKGQLLGTVVVYYDGEKYGETKLVSYSDIEKSNVVYLKNKIRAIISSWYFKLFILVLIIFLAYKTFTLNKKRKSP